MATYAMVHEATGFVANVVLWDGDTTMWSPPPGYIMVPETDPPSASVGGNWDGEKFSPPPAGIPGPPQEQRDPTLFAGPSISEVFHDGNE